MTTVFATPDRLCYITELTEAGDRHRSWEMRSRYPNYRTDYTECRRMFEDALPMGIFLTTSPHQFPVDYYMVAFIRSGAEGCQAYLYGKYGDDAMITADGKLQIRVQGMWLDFPDAKAAARAIVENWDAAYQEAVRRADERQSIIIDLAVQQKDYDDALAAQIAALHETNLLAADADGDADADA